MKTLIAISIPFRNMGEALEWAKLQTQCEGTVYIYEKTKGRFIVYRAATEADNEPRIAGHNQWGNMVTMIFTPLEYARPKRIAIEYCMGCLTVAQAEAKLNAPSVKQGDNHGKTLRRADHAAR